MTDYINEAGLHMFGIHSLYTPVLPAVFFRHLALHNFSEVIFNED